MVPLEPHPCKQEQHDVLSHVVLTWALQNNATHETQGPYANTTHFYFDSLYCRCVILLRIPPKLTHTKTHPHSWDTFRTFYPLMALHSPVQFAQIVDNYIDGYLKQGWMPECRANNLPGWTQGGTFFRCSRASVWNEWADYNYSR